MKITITFFALLLTLSMYAQDKAYLHTATADNTGGHITYPDHQDLNGNPDADILFLHTIIVMEMST